MLAKAWSRRDHIRKTFESWRLTFRFGQSFPQRQMGRQGGEACLRCLVGSLDDGVPRVVIRPCGRMRRSALLKVYALAAPWALQSRGRSGVALPENLPELEAAAARAPASFTGMGTGSPLV